MSEVSPLIIYDSECAFCTWCVLFVIQRDAQPHYHFTSLTSKTALDFFAAHHITDTEAIWLLRPDESFYNRSSATIRIVSSLGGIYRAASLGLLIPRPIRDWVYTFIANRRRRLLANATCPVIPSEFQDRFIV